jgi:hypothetical protein
LGRLQPLEVPPEQLDGSLRVVEIFVHGLAEPLGQRHKRRPDLQLRHHWHIVER